MVKFYDKMQNNKYKSVFDYSHILLNSFIENIEEEKHTLTKKGNKLH